MPREILWSPSAFQQLESVYKSMAESASFVAGPFVERWLDMVEEILRYPDIGKRLDEFQPEEIRERIFGGYRLVYEVDGSSIAVLAILEQ